MYKLKDEYLDRYSRTYHLINETWYNILPDWKQAMYILVC